MIKTRIVIVAVMALFLVVLVKTPSCSASFVTAQKDTLKGLKGVWVLVEGLTPNAIKAGLTKEQITTDVEAKLRIAGIKVLTKEESYTTPGTPCLYVNLNFIKLEETVLSAFSIDLELQQTVLLDRELSMSCIANTWSQNYCGGVGKDKIQFVRDKIKDLVDMFINDYLAVNPKK